MKRILFVVMALALFISACTSVVPSPPPATDRESVETPPAVEIPTEVEPPEIEGALPIDPAVRIGQLDNGFTYYIRQNDEPMNRAELWLAVDAGSLLEDDDQLGLAHFLEHMLFNGTENFEGMAIVDFFETIGMEFGPDINAFTSFDETVYMLQVPSDDSESVNTAFDVLRDWAAFATISPEEVDKERGVVVEEWRLRNETASGRINDKILPFILNESRYADRLPIGDMDVVRNAPAETLRRYYETWYRPDLMGLVAVGDFDAGEIEALISEHFTDLSSPSDPVARTDYTVPAHENTTFLVVTDPEETVTQIQVIRKRDSQPLLTETDFRDDLITDLFYSMLNQRLDEIERQPDAPFLAAGVGAGQLVRPVAADFIAALVEDDKVEPGLEALLTEVERVRRHGFADTELERAKIDLLRFHETIYDERENIDNGALAGQYLDHFLASDPIPSIEYLYELAQRLIPEITLAEANEKSTALAASDNREVIVTAPEKADLELPSEDDLAASFSKVLAQEIAAYEDEVIDAPLLADIPEPAAILSEREIGDLDAVELELANGVRVLIKATDFKDDEVLVRAISPGGSSLVADEDFPEATTIANIIAQSGLGEFDQSAVEKLLTGKAVGVFPYIAELSEGFSGAASPEDLETLFQLIHLYVTAPRQDQDAFDVFQNQQRTVRVNRDRDPNAALQDALLQALYGSTIRRGPLSLEAIDTLDYEKGLEFYQDRFSDAGDFDFVFVGSLDPEELGALAQTYLGALPANGREETWQDVAPSIPEESVETVVYKGEGDRATVQIVFTGPLDSTTKNRRRLSALEGVLDIVLREELREELAGVYSSRVSTSLRELPESLYFVVVSYTADPDRVDELVEATLDQVRLLQADGPKEIDVEKVHSQLISNREEALEQNGFWLSLLEDYAFYGDEELLDTASFEEQVLAVTAEDIQQAAIKYLREDQYVKAVLYPEALNPKAE
ncbi:MAG: insulinase family protein [Chloroflexi bacterium]|nr:insulinase family protein [Chloroflexota bacterium]